MDKDNDLEDSSQLEILRGILTEVQDLNSQLARTDERSRQNSSDVNRLREDRIAPLEEDVTRNETRSRRNSLILGAGISLITLLGGGAATYLVSLI